MSESSVHVVHAPDQSSATLEFAATNSFTASFVSIFLGILALLPFGLSVAATANGRMDVAAVCALIVLGAIWGIRRFVWRPKRHWIHFDQQGLEVGGQRFEYGEIADIGVGEMGGDSYDPASMPVPRNVTTGPHVYIILNSDSHQRPITVTMPRERAQEVADTVRRLMNFFAD